MRDSVNVDVVIFPSLYFQMCHQAMYTNTYHNLCVYFFHAHVVILYSCAPDFMSK